MENQTMDTKNNFMIPFAIVIAGGLVALAILFGGQETTSNAQPTQVAPQPISDKSADNIKPVSSEDHIKGNPNAQVKIVEFSDIECPYCKTFHPTMQRIIEEYGQSGKVAWVYRHFPLDSHSKARLEASAAELAGDIGGNNKFWEYLDKIFEITPGNNGLDLNLLPQIAEEIGLDPKPFEDLVSKDDRSGGKYASRIEDNYQDGIASGVRGTPHSIVIAPNGKKFTINGAQSYSTVKSIIELALTEK